MAAGAFVGRGLLTPWVTKRRERDLERERERTGGRAGEIKGTKDKIPLGIQP
jgi:hypothetical protein